MAGTAPNTLDGELLPPFHDVTIVGNLVHDNGNVDAPALAFEWAARGNGILLAGGGNSYVVRNRVLNHPQSGIAIFPKLDANFYMSYDHHIVGNFVEGSGLADLTMGGQAPRAIASRTTNSPRHCPPHSRSSSRATVSVSPHCSRSGRPRRSWAVSSSSAPGSSRRSISPRCRVPAPQPNMPGGAAAQVVPAVDVSAGSQPDIDSIVLPDLPEGLVVSQEKGIKAGQSHRLDGGGAGDSLPRVIAYFIGKSSIPAWQRWVFITGGMLVYLLFLGLGLVVGGIV